MGIGWWSPSRRHLLTSGDISGCHCCGLGGGSWLPVGRGSNQGAQPSTSTPQILQLQMPTLPRPGRKPCPTGRDPDRRHVDVHSPETVHREVIHPSPPFCAWQQPEKSKAPAASWPPCPVCAQTFSKCRKGKYDFHQTDEEAGPEG